MPGDTYTADDYIDDVEGLVDGFRYETCAECSEDLNRHAIIPGPLGKPFAQCLTSEEEAEHPEHVDCADGCGLAVTHTGPCRSKPGGPVICTEHNHIGPD